MGGAPSDLNKGPSSRASPKSPTSRSLNSEDQVYSISIKKPLGVSIGKCMQGGSLVSGIEATGNAAKWNEECESNDFDEGRVLNVGDRILKVSTAGGKLMDVGALDPMGMLDFFSHKTGSVIIMQLLRVPLTPEALAQLQKSRLLAVIFEPLLLPLKVTANLSSLKHIKLEKNSNSSGVCISSTDVSSIKDWNTDCESKGEVQNALQIGDVLTCIEPKPGVVINLIDKTLEEVEQQLGKLSDDSGDAVCRFRRSMDPSLFNPRSLVFKIPMKKPFGLKLTATEYGTCVTGVEAEGAAATHNKATSSSDKKIKSRDYVVGIGAGIDSIVNTEGENHMFITESLDTLANNNDEIIIKFKRMFRKN